MTRFLFPYTFMTVGISCLVGYLIPSMSRVFNINDIGLSVFFIFGIAFYVGVRFFRVNERVMTRAERWSLTCWSTFISLSLTIVLAVISIMSRSDLGDLWQALNNISSDYQHVLLMTVALGLFIGIPFVLALGYFSYKLGCSFGKVSPRLWRAIRRYQNRNDMVPLGIPTRAMIEKLRAKNN